MNIGGRPLLAERSHVGAVDLDDVALVSVEPLKQLHARWAPAIHFLDIFIRQEHPGPAAQPYSTLDQKILDAVSYQQRKQIPWTVLVDDLRGTVHQAYGGLSAPTYLIDVDGRVAFYNMWTHAPTLHIAIDALIRQKRPRLRQRRRRPCPSPVRGAGGRLAGHFETVCRSSDRLPTRWHACRTLATGGMCGASPSNH